MAVCPFAVKKLIPPGSNDPRITATQVILHVAVFEGESLHEFFRDRSGGIESHFYIRRDGTIEQYRDTAYQADANHTANDRAVSIETQGMGDGEWTPEQVDAIKRLLLWARDEHKIPLRKCPRHDAAGVGYHVMFGAPGPWTPVAKSCPGPDRVRQFERVIVPWLSSNPTSTTTTEDDMPDPRDFLDEPLNKHDPKGRPSSRGLTVAESLSLIPIIAKQIGGEAAAALEQMQSSPVKKES